MKLDRVTITGADNSIRPNELVALTRKYPFVEWGILLSAGENGSARFPRCLELAAPFVMVEAPA